MRTLLLADDNVTVQRVIALTFAQEPVRVVTASDGHQAMDRMALERPDIVLAGTTLPQVNGYELARFVRSKAEFRNIPVLLLSGAFETVDEAQLKSSGAAGVIEKPVEPTTVISRVKELLGLKPAATREAGTAPSPSPPVAKSAPPHPSTPGPRGGVPGPPAATEVDPLDSAYDTLDQQMAGKVPAAQRNPSPPLGHTAGSRDPRSPGKPPASGQTADPGNPVYEVDEDWFADGEPKPTEAPTAPEREPPAPRVEAAVVDEGDDEWFVEDQKAREARELEQKELAAEMGIHEVELPPQVQQVQRVQQVQQVQDAPVAPVAPVAPAQEEFEPEPVARSLPIDWFAQGASKQKPAPPGVVERPAAPAPIAVAAPTPIAEFASARPMTSATPGRVADDFAALLAFEQGENTRPPMIEPVIHAVTPEITPEMLEQIASTVADRLRDSVRVEPKAPEITGDMLGQIATMVAERLHDRIRIEPKAPEITGEMIEAMALLVSKDVRDHIRVEPAAPELNDGMLNHIAGVVAERLRDSVRVEARAPELHEGMLHFIAGTVADRLRDTLRVEAKAPELNEGMLQFIAGTVADRLRESIRIEPRAPELTDDLLGRIAEQVAARLKDRIRVEPAMPELTPAMLDQIAGTVTTRLTDTVEGSVAGSVQVIIAEMKDALVAAVKASAVPPELTAEMLDHVAWTVADRVTNAMPVPPPPAPPIISDDMLNVVAARVAEQVQGHISIDRIKDSITESVRDTVRAIVAETSERLVREEIERIKSKAQ